MPKVSFRYSNIDFYPAPHDTNTSERCFIGLITRPDACVKFVQYMQLFV